MCGHGGLLVNVVFSLTGIFHGSAGGMSSGHTWHWGTPERSYQIPLGKPGLVIPRCETPASRSVTFSLHQRKALRSNPPLPVFFRHEDLQLRVQRGKKGCMAKERENTLYFTPTTAKHVFRERIWIMCISLRKLLRRPGDHRSPAHLHQQVQDLALGLCMDTLKTSGTHLVS